MRIFPWIKLSWHSCSMLDKLGWRDISVRVCFPLIQKDSITHMHGLAVYVKEGLPFARDLFIEASTDRYLCFRPALLHSVSHFFFLDRSPSSSLYTIFDSVSSNIRRFDEVLSIKSSAAFVSRKFNVNHKDWLTFSGGTDGTGERCSAVSTIIFLSVMVASFPTRIPDYNSHIPALLDLFLSSDATIFSTIVSFHLENLIMLLYQFLLTF